MEIYGIQIGQDVREVGVLVLEGRRDHLFHGLIRLCYEVGSWTTQPGSHRPGTPLLQFFFSPVCVVEGRAVVIISPAFFATEMRKS